ncbi:MAG: hypothetical protein H6618_08970 [Deltaproteobacteria bacterium]|nr:hypothetical protein [Deltaproteobacteria bacterium]
MKIFSSHLSIPAIIFSCMSLFLVPAFHPTSAQEEEQETARELVRTYQARLKMPNPSRIQAVQTYYKWLMPFRKNYMSVTSLMIMIDALEGDIAHAEEICESHPAVKEKQSKTCPFLLKPEVAIQSARQLISALKQGDEENLKEALQRHFQNCLCMECYPKSGLYHKEDQSHIATENFFHESPVYHAAKESITSDIEFYLTKLNPSKQNQESEHVPDQLMAEKTDQEHTPLTAMEEIEIQADSDSLRAPADLLRVQSTPVLSAEDDEETFFKRQYSSPY